MKQVVRELIKNDVKSARVRNMLIDKFDLDSSTLPLLKTIQNFVYHFKRTGLSNTDLVNEMTTMSRVSQCDDVLADTTPFTFGYEVVDNKQPVLGDGPIRNPFVIGVSPKRLLQNADRDPASFVFHMDATFKLRACGYPVSVCRVSDSKRQFHSMAFMITSQRTEAEYASALRSLCDQFFVVVQKCNGALCHDSPQNTAHTLVPEEAISRLEGKKDGLRT